MTRLANPGVLVLSVNTYPRLAAEADLAARRYECEAILAHLSSLKLPATWAIAGQIAIVVHRALSVHPDHDVAITLETTSLGGAANRATFAVELARCVGRARSMGLPATTLVLNGHVPCNLGLLAGHGISAIYSIMSPMLARQRSRGTLAAITNRLSAREPGRRPNGTPRSPRWGLWEFDPSVELFEVGLRRTVREMERATVEGSYLHVRIDADKLHEKGAAGLKALERLTRYAVELRTGRVLECTSLAGAVRRISSARRRTPARSILAARAA